MDEFASATSTYIADKESGRVGLIQALQSLITLYPAHIGKEDYLLFPMTTKVLSSEDDKLLPQQFTEVESGLGSDAYGTYDALADALMQRVGECPQCCCLTMAPIDSICSGNSMRYSLSFEIAIKSKYVAQQARINQ